MLQVHFLWYLQGITKKVIVMLQQCYLNKGGNMGEIKLKSCQKWHRV